MNQSGSLSLATAAYDGAAAITSGATYQWAKYVSGKWTDITNATASTLAVSGSEILNIQSYRCTMTYGGKTYVDVITVEDKSDPYVSEMLSIGGFTVKNNLGGVVPYIIVRTNQKEVDALLGGISETPPSSPASGAFWYKVDHTAKTVTLMKYNSTEWANAAEAQSLTYTWYKQDKDGNAVEFGKSGKVIYLSAEDSDDWWRRKLRCQCGHAFAKTKWHKKKEITTYAYKCYSQNRTGTVSARQKRGLSIEGVCPVPMVQDWKLFTMAQKVFHTLFDDAEATLQEAEKLLGKGAAEVEQTDLLKDKVSLEEQLQQEHNRYDTLHGYADE